jgi:hypothetical protein
MKLTDSEKKMLEEMGDWFSSEPRNAVDEGLLASYRDDENERPLVAFSHRALKEVILKIIKDRNIEIDENEQFSISDETVIGDNKSGISVELLKDQEKLKKYVEEKSKGMSLDELESFSFYIKELLEDIHFDYLAKNIAPTIQNLNYLFTESGVSFDEEQDEETVNTVFDNINTSKSNEEKKVSDEQVCNILKMLNTYPEIMTMKTNASIVFDLIKSIKKEKTLEEFKEDKNFYQELEKIMTHDSKRHNYLFHGTQCIEDAESIIKQGLGMMNEGLETTTYSELNIDELLLYSRGFGGEIGRDAIVVIDMPIDEDGKPQKIVEEKSEDQEVSFSPSGLQGLGGKANYVVNSRYIVGYVDKRNKHVIFNPQYYDYERINVDNKNISLGDIRDAVNEQKKEK